MSAKFKKGDLVEILHINEHRTYAPGATPGKIGIIIRYSGNYYKNIDWVENAWAIEIASAEYQCAERALRLVPGGDEYKEIGSWSEMSWSPYKNKEHV